YHSQRAQQLPVVNANAGVTVTGERNGSNNNNNGSGSGSGSGSSSGNLKLSANYTAGISVPSFDIDLFGRLRSLTHAQLQQYFATEAGARATRLTLVSDIANAWLDFATDSSLLAIAQQTTTSAQQSVRLTSLRLNG